MEPHEVTRILEVGAELGCTEALFTFGERPEEVPGFSSRLRALGYPTFLSYLSAMCEKSIEYGLLPHTNAGLLSSEEMKSLMPVTASMGLMLETTAKVPAHRGCLGKDPELRLNMIEEAGRLKIPFTTGLLLGIGESYEDRRESLTLIMDLHKRYHHIQEIILQNFIPKKGTALADIRGPDIRDIGATIRLAREIVGDTISLQISPNLIDASPLISSGVDDFGGISPLTIDHINPDHPWPKIDELRRLAGERGLVERLCIYPRYISQGWYHPALESLITKLAHIIKERS